jgi:two-component system sensor histidine kinase KdpD
VSVPQGNGRARVLANLLGLHRQTTRQRVLGAFAGTTSAVAGTLLVAVGLTGLLHVANNMLLFLPAVVFAAVRYGFAAAIWSATLSILATSFTLAEPLYSFAVDDTATVWAMFVFVIVAALVSSLAALIRDQVLAIQRQNRFTEAMYGFSARLIAVATFDELAQAFESEARQMLNADVQMVRSAAAATTYSPRLEACCRSHEVADGVDATGCYELCVPLTSAGECLAVAHVRREAATGELTGEERRVLDTLINHTLTTLDRVRLADRARDASMRAEADRMRAALLTAVSHDLKTPLASILGNISSLRHYAPLYDEAMRNEMLESAEAETERLGRFVENLLDMTRIDAGAVVAHLEKVDLGDVVGSALKSAERVLARHWVRVDLPAELPMVDADCVLLDHILVNLLDNAGKYSPEGSTIVISALQSADELGLRVEDEGQGIPHADIDRVFDRFFRVRGDDRSPAGTGLGLAICKSFAEVMGARVVAENRSGARGSCFTVWLRSNANANLSPVR